MTIEERLAAAERRIADLERRLGPVMPRPLDAGFNLRDMVAVCPNGCPTNSICGNAACPLWAVVTCGTSAAAQ